MVKIIFLLFFAAFANFSYSFSYMVHCKEPTGMRADYFLSNNIRGNNDTFLFSKDKASGNEPSIFFSKSKALILLSDSNVIGIKEEESQRHSAILEYVVNNEDVTTMTGLINGAPYLVSYFPKLNISYYTTQRPFFIGGYSANVVSFASICDKPKLKTEFENQFLKQFPNKIEILEKLSNF